MASIIGDLLEESDLLEYFKKKPLYSQKKTCAVRYLIDIVNNPSSLITLCNLTKDSDLQAGILEALFKDDSNLVQSFKLELLWNKYQIFKNESIQERFEVNSFILQKL